MQSLQKVKKKLEATKGYLAMISHDKQRNKQQLKCVEVSNVTQITSGKKVDALEYHVQSEESGASGNVADVKKKKEEREWKK